MPLVFENQEGDTYTLPFLHGTNGLGDATYSLFVKEADNSTDFVIGIGDYVVLSSGTTRNSKTYALQYNSIDTTGKTVTFNKLTSSSEQISASYSTDGMPDGTLGEGTLNLPAVTSTFYIEDATGNKLAMDFNGGGNIDGTAVDIITNGGAIINLGTTNDISFPFSFEITTEASAMEEASTDEAVSFQISGGSIVGIDVNSFSNIDLSSDADSYNGMTRYGAEYKLENTNNNDPEKLTIQYPLQQRFVDVKIELLKSTSTSTSIQEGQQSPCTNGIMDGDETGVDCGGSCSSCDEEGEETEGQDLEMGTEIEQTDLTEQSEDQCSEGCIYIDKEEKAICLSIGEFIDELYCSSPNKLLQQKRNGEECDTDYECVSNKCEEKKCGKSYSLFTMILNIALVFFLILIVIIVITLLKE